jgi:mannose-6-phosphate isomerase-like protein (cupin superfamily)
MAVEAKPKGKVITARTPLLSTGRTTTFVARTDTLAVAVKVYAEGGENTLHAHTNNDHLHFVLDGQATFYDEEGNTTVVNKNEGMFLPKGAYYYFHASGGTNLVLLSSYAYEGGASGEVRLGIDGKPLPGYSEENKHVEGVPIPGKFYGD